MADRPILFSAPMIRALLEDHKFQTRRIINFAGIEKVVDFVKVATDMEGRPVYEMKDASGEHIARPAGKGLVDYHFSPRFAVGDRLWVRETWRSHSWYADCVEIAYAAQRGLVGWSEQHEQIKYPNGDRNAFKFYAPKGPDFWRPSLFMPRWASRLTLIVTDVRVERLQDISEEDALAEGADISPDHRSQITDGPMVKVGPGTYMSPIAWYHRLWNAINGENAWQANPWVVAVAFEVLKQNIDEVRP
jgi:hypothetical protein